MINRDNLFKLSSLPNPTKDMSDSELLEYIESDAVVLAALDLFKYSWDKINDDNLVIKVHLPNNCRMIIDKVGTDINEEAIKLFDNIDLDIYREKALKLLKEELNN